MTTEKALQTIATTLVLALCVFATQHASAEERQFNGTDCRVISGNNLTGSSSLVGYNFSDSSIERLFSGLALQLQFAIGATLVVKHCHSLVYTAPH